MSYNGGIIAHAVKAKRKHKLLFLTMVTEVERSIRFGSEITGAPGQPVDTANLRDSWIGKYLSTWVWRISTNVEYAPFIEDDIGNKNYRVGGPHSVKLTILGAQRILARAKEVADRAA
jgi:hypothetical protein